MVPPPLLRRIRLAALGLVAALGALLWLVSRPTPGVTEPGAPRQARTIPFTDVHPYGANFFLQHEVNEWDRKKTVEMAREGGIRYAKQQFMWSYIEPEPGNFEWSDYDEIVDLYRQNDIEVIARLDWPPRWVQPAEWAGRPSRLDWNVPPADLQDYARFVAAVAEHFRGRVRFYQIWNEPNLVSEWGFNPSHPVDPKEYAHMLRVASRAIREADPNAVILLAPLAINTETVDIAGNMSDLAFLEGLYEAGAEQYFDIVSANAFGMDQPPEAPPAPDELNFRRVELQRAIMEEHGDGDKSIWMNEYGWNAAPPDALEMFWKRVSEEEQAEYTVDGVHWGQENWLWSGVFSIWYFRQWGGKTPDRAVYYFRMVDTDWTKRRVYDAVKSDSDRLWVAGSGDWGERSSPVRLPTDLAERDRWTWAFADGALDGNVLVTNEPGAELAFRFKGPAVAIRVRTGPQAGTLHTEIDGRAVRASAESAGMQLKAPEQRWEWRTLASGLGDAEHELRLTVGTAGGEVMLDGFRVLPPTNGPSGPSTPVVLIAGLAALLAALLVVDVRHAARRIRVE